MRLLLLSVAAVGDGDEPTLQGRRMRAVNFGAFAGVVLNAGFMVLWVVVDAGYMAPIIAVNVLSIGGFGFALVASTRRRSGLAVKITFTTAAINTIAVGLFFGRATGGWMFVILIPILGVLWTPAHSKTARVVAIGAGSALFATVAVAAGDTPEPFASENWEGLLLFSGTFVVAVTASAIVAYFRTKAEETTVMAETLSRAVESAADPRAVAASWAKVSASAVQPTSIAVWVQLD